jgi:chromosome partitioning protein
MPARLISFVNCKGGVGKTSVVVNIAGVLAHDLDLRVLVVDCDAQANASSWLMGLGHFRDSYSVENSTFGVLTAKAPFLQNAIRRSVVQIKGQIQIPKLDLLPAVYELVDVEDGLAMNGDLVPFLAKFYETLKAIVHDYDYILFDCPPHVFRATQAALFASREIYVPCNPDPLSDRGLSLLSKRMLAFYHLVQSSRFQMVGHRLAKIRGIILNNVPRGNIEHLIGTLSNKLSYLRQEHSYVCQDATILPTRIRHTVAATKVIEEDVPFILSRNNPDLREDYVNLARYIHHTPTQP